MNVVELEGSMLNFWVAKSEGLELLTGSQAPGALHDVESGSWHPSSYHPAADWSQGGAIVAREWYVLEETLGGWLGARWPFMKVFSDQPLVWFMRAFVASKFGDEVEDI